MVWLARAYRAPRFDRLAALFGVSEHDEASSRLLLAGAFRQEASFRFSDRRAGRGPA